MPDDSTRKIHKHLKHNMSVYELNLFSFFTPKYVSSCILFLSVNGTTIHPATAAKILSLSHSCSPTLNQWLCPAKHLAKISQSYPLFACSHHYSENSFRVLPAPCQLPCNMLSCRHHYLLIPPCIIFHSLVILSRSWFPTYSMLFPTSVSLCSGFFFSFPLPYISISFFLYLTTPVSRLS